MVSDEEVKECNKRSPLLCQREVFEDVFDGLENVLAKMFSDIAGFDYKELKDQIMLKKYKDVDAKFLEERKYFFVSLDKDGILNLKVNKNSNLGRLFKDMDIMFLHLDFFESDQSSIEVPLFKICIKRYKIANCFGRLLFAFLDTNWCEKIYREEKDFPKFIKWGALFNCDNVLKIKEIIKELMTEEEQFLFMERLESLV